MIVTVTPNPSIDRTVEIEAMRRGEVNRAVGGRGDPRGEGGDVSPAAGAGGGAAGAGSLPGGLGNDFYARLVRLLRDGAAQVCIDSSGAPLAEVVDAGPDLIKPNAEELAELVGRRLRRLGEVLDAAAEVRKRGVG